MNRGIVVRVILLIGFIWMQSALPYVKFCYPSQFFPSKHLLNHRIVAPFRCYSYWYKKNHNSMRCYVSLFSIDVCRAKAALYRHHPTESITQELIDYYLWGEEKERVVGFILQDSISIFGAATIGDALKMIEKQSLFHDK